MEVQAPGGTCTAHADVQDWQLQIEKGEGRGGGGWGPEKLLEH
jgi:hypothetical protein